MPDSVDQAAAAPQILTQMTTTVGQLDNYDPSKENWECYFERFEQFVVINNIAPERQVACLLAVIGPTTYGALRNLVYPQKPKEKTLQEISAVLEERFTEKKVEIAERFRFYTAVQESESIAQFVARLKKLARHCNFGGKLNEMIRDRLVCGIKDRSTQKKLLVESGLTLEKAVKVAVADEAANKDVAELAKARGLGPTTNNEVHRVKPATPYPSSKKESTSKGRVKCKHCGRNNHPAEKCKFKSATCHKCKKQGHIAPVCKSTRRSGVHAVEEQDPYPSETDDDEYSDFSSMYNISGGSECPIMVDVQIENVPVHMELDTGSGKSIIGEKLYKEKFSSLKIHPSTMTFVTYTKEEVKPLGYLDVEVKYGDQQLTLSLYVIKTDAPPLFGREWLQNIQLDWPQIHAMITPVDINQLLNQHGSLFDDQLGTLKGIQAKLTLKDGASPVFHKARPVPFAKRNKVSEKLDQLESQGIIEKVQYSEWAAPIVAVDKPDGSVRICGDFKVTVNPVMEVDKYPLPRIEEIFANMAGGERFSKLDLRHAYLQMEVAEECRHLLTVNTHQGLYRYKRLVYGIASAPAVWQKAMDQVLQGLPNVQCYIDDIIVTGKTDEEHCQNLHKVMTRLEEAGLKLNKEKCEFLKDQVEYCGHVINKDGLCKPHKKVEAVTNAPSPQNVNQLRSWLGFVNYYHKFLPNLATELQPLHVLLKHDTPWHWGKKQESAFAKVKSMVASDTVLTHYDPEKELRVAADASAYGVGCVLSHVMPDGSEKPVAFASRTLNDAEKLYPQLQKEALAIVWGVKTFQYYLEGRPFTLVTDHKPLTTIFHPHKGISSTATARIQRWALFLSGFSYQIEYKNTKAHANADGLSRLPLPCTKEEKERKDPADVFQFKQIERLPVTVQELQRETRNNPTLAKVMQATMSGWPAKREIDTELLPYFNKRDELTVHDGCLLWGGRVIVPPKLQQRVLEELHEGHVGIVKMKGLARSYFWWPGLDRQIESTCKACEGCALTQSNPPSAPVHRWEFPEKPWDRVHVDYAGPFMNSMFLIAVDAHSKWPEVSIMSSTTSAKTIEALRTMFATHGLPSQIVSDNGPQFVSAEFNTFLKLNGIQHLTSAPYHPRTNGLAERFVRTMKAALKNDKSTAPLQYKLDTFLLKYRNCPHATTGNSPAVMLMGRPLRCRLDLLKPDIAKRVKKNTQSAHPQEKHMRHFNIGDTVLARSYGRGDPWTVGVVTKKTGPISYQVQVGSSVWRRHLNQLRSCELPVTQVVPESTATATEPSFIPQDLSVEHSIPSTETSTSKQPQVETSPEDTLQDNSNDVETTVISEDPQTPTTQPEAKATEEHPRPSRNRRQPVWMKDYLPK